MDFESVEIDDLKIGDFVRIVSSSTKHSETVLTYQFRVRDIHISLKCQEVEIQGDEITMSVALNDSDPNWSDKIERAVE